MVDRLLVDLQIAANPVVTGLQGVLRRVNAELTRAGEIPVNIDARQLNRTTQRAQALSRAFARAGVASNDLADTARRLTTLDRSLRRPVTLMGELGRQAAITTRRFGTFIVVSQGLRQITSSLSAATKEAIAFNSELVKTTQLLSRGDVQLSGPAAVGNVRDAIDSSARGLGVNPQELTQVANTLAQAGRTTSEISSLVRSLSRASLTATFGDLGDSAENVEAILGQFNIAVGQADRVLDGLNSVTKVYNVSVDELFEGVRRTGTAFAALSGAIRRGVGDERNVRDLQQLIGLITAVVSTSRESAATVGTSFRTILPRLGRTDTQEQLRSVGIEITDDAGNLRPLGEVFANISQGLRGIAENSPEYLRVVESLGGLRQFNRVAAVIENFGRVTRSIDIQEGAAGSIDRDVNLALEDLGRQLARVREEFSFVIREFSETGTFRAVADAFILVARGVATLSRAIAAIAPLLPILGGVGAVLAGRTAIGGVTNFLGRFSQNFFGGFNSGGTVGRQRLQSGGRAVALTPGEIVITPDMISKIPGGYDTLQKINNGGSLNNFRLPSGISIVPGTGNSDSVFTSLPDGSFVLRKRVSESILSQGIQRANSGGVIGRQGFQTGGRLLGGNREATQALIAANRTLFREFAQTARILGQDVRQVVRVVAQNLRAGLSPQQIRFQAREQLSQNRAVQARRADQRAVFGGASEEDLIRLRQTRNLENRRRQQRVAARAERRANRAAQLPFLDDVAAANRNRVPQTQQPPNPPLPPRPFRSRAADRVFGRNNIVRNNLGRIGIGTSVIGGVAGFALAGSENPLARGAGNILQASSFGAGIGSFAGPIGTVVGGIVGALGGLVTVFGDASDALERNFDQSISSINNFQGFRNAFTGEGNLDNLRTLRRRTADVLSGEELSRRELADTERFANPVREQLVRAIESEFRQRNDAGATQLTTEDVLRELARPDPNTGASALISAERAAAATDQQFRENAVGATEGQREISRRAALIRLIQATLNIETERAAVVRRATETLAVFADRIEAAQLRFLQFEQVLATTSAQIQNGFDRISGNFVPQAAEIPTTFSNGRALGDPTQVQQELRGFLGNLNVNPDQGFADFSSRLAGISAFISSDQFRTGITAAIRRDSVRNANQEDDQRTPLRSFFTRSRTLRRLVGNNEELQNIVFAAIERNFENQSGNQAIADPDFGSNLESVAQDLEGGVIELYENARDQLQEINQNFLANASRLNSSIVENRGQLNRVFQGRQAANDQFRQLRGEGALSASVASAIQQQLGQNLLNSQDSNVNLNSISQVGALARSLETQITDQGETPELRAEANLRLQSLTAALEANTNQTVRLSAAQERLAEIQRTQNNARNFIQGLAAGDPRALEQRNQAINDIRAISRGERLPVERFQRAQALVDSLVNSLTDDQLQQRFGLNRQQIQNNIQRTNNLRALGNVAPQDRDVVNQIGQNALRGNANVQESQVRAEIAQILNQQATSIEALRQIQERAIIEQSRIIDESFNRQVEALSRVFRDPENNPLVAGPSETIVSGEVQVIHNGLDVLRNLEQRVVESVRSVLEPQLQQLGVPLEDGIQ